MREGRTAEGKAPRGVIWPHQYEVMFWLALFPVGATSRELYEEYYVNRPSYQTWSPRKVANNLVGLRRRGLVEMDSTSRVWALTLKGHAFITGDLMDEALERLRDG